MAIRPAEPGRRRCRRPTGRASSTSRSTTASRTWSSATSRRPRHHAAAGDARRRRPGPSRRRPRAAGSTRGTASGSRSAGSADGAWIAATGERETGPAGPVAAAGARASPRTTRDRARSPTRCRPSCATPSRRRACRLPSASSSRPATGSGSRAPSGARTPRPASAAGRRVPTIVYPHGGPTGQSFRSLPAVQAAAGRGGLRLLRRRLPRVDRLRPRLPRRQPRRVGPRRRARSRRRRALGRRAALVGRPAGDLWRLVRRLPGAVRARRRAGDVAGRRGPVRRLGDRRELSPRRPSRPAGSPQDDGLARRPRPDRRLPARLAGLSARSGSRRRC